MKKNMTFREGLNLALHDEMRADPSVFVFGLDVQDHKSIFGSTAGLTAAFGAKRCFGTPLSEDAMTGVALGAALNGLKPVHVHIRVDFMLLAMNQIANMISCAQYVSNGKLKVPLVIRAVIGRGWGQGAQHSKTMQSVFAHIPGLKVVMPATPQDAYSLLRASIQDEQPVIFLEHRWFYDVVGEVDTELPGVIGQAGIRRQGKDVSVICTSWMAVEALKAASVLERRGIDLEVIDIRTAAPLDSRMLADSVRKTRRALIADYDWLHCGMSAEIAARLASDCFGELECPIERIGFAPVPCPTTRPLEDLFYPSAVQIIRRVEKMMSLTETDLSQETFYSWEEKFKGPF